MKDPVEILTAKYKQSIFDCDWAIAAACYKELSKIGVEVQPESTLPTLLPKIGIDELGDVLFNFSSLGDGKTPIYFMFTPDDEGVYIGFFPFTLEEAEKNTKEYLAAFEAFDDED